MGTTVRREMMEQGRRPSRFVDNRGLDKSEDSGNGEVSSQNIFYWRWKRGRKPIRFVSGVDD